MKYVIHNFLKDNKGYHKPNNYVGRILYLLYLFKNYKNNEYVKKNIINCARTFLYSIHKYIRDIKKNSTIKNENIFLNYYKIKNNNYKLITIKIFLKTLVIAFLDVLYLIKEDGKIMMREKNNLDTFNLNFKNIQSLDKSPESQYLKILNLVFENTGRSKIKTINTHIKLTNRHRSSKISKHHSVPSNSKKTTQKHRQVKTI